MNQMFDRYVMFVSAECLVVHWSALAGSDLSLAAVATAQAAGRVIVSDFMQDEAIYWNIDFSPERHKRSYALYSKKINHLSPSDLAVLEVLRMHFSEDEDEQGNAIYALTLFTRLVNDVDFRKETGFSRSEVDLIAACIPTKGDDVLDTSQVLQGWLSSEDDWDVRLRHLTPDVPDYVATNFLSAWHKNIRFPVFIRNLSLLLDADDKRRFVVRLRQVLVSTFPKTSKLAIPRLLELA